MVIHTSHASKICVVKNPTLVGKEKITTDKTMTKQSSHPCPQEKIVAAFSRLASHLSNYSSPQPQDPCFSRNYWFPQHRRDIKAVMELIETGWRRYLPNCPYPAQLNPREKYIYLFQKADVS